MTVEQILALVDGVKKGELNDEIKIRWIGDVDGTVQSEIHGVPAEKIVLPEASDDKLAVPEAYGRVYMLYILAMTALAEGDTAAYRQLSKDYESALAMYARYYIRTRK